MPRTATTFFQNKFFPLFSGLDFHQLPETHFDRSFQHLLYQDESLYRAHEVELSLRKKLNGLVSLFSNENFIGQSLYMVHGNRSRTASRLSAAFPEAEVILFLRGQVDLLKSLYAIDVTADLTARPDGFVFENKGGYSFSGSRWQDYAVYNTLEPREHIEGYRYKELLDLYHAQFKKVHVFLYEDFRADPIRTTQRLTDLLGQSWTKEIEEVVLNKQKVNASVGAKSAERLRRLNRWFPITKGRRYREAVYHRMKRRILSSDHPERIAFSQEKEERLVTYFSEANKELMDAYPDLGLSRYAEEYCLA